MTMKWAGLIAKELKNCSFHDGKSLTGLTLGWLRK